MFKQVKNRILGVGVENKTTLVRVNEVTRSVFYSPQYVAIAKNFFEDYGIEIELTTGQGADAVMTSILLFSLLIMNFGIGLLTATGNLLGF